MAVTLDTSASSGAITSGGDYTVAITVASNSDRVLYVFAGTGVGSGIDDIIGVSSDLDGALTEIAQETDSGWMNLQVWRKTAPTAGAHTITVDTNAGANQKCAFAISLYGVDQTTPEGTITEANGTSAAPTGAVTLAAGDMAVGGLATDSATGVSVTTGTQRQEVENVGSDTAYSLATNTGTGSVSITWGSGNEGYALIIVPVKAAGGGGGTAVPVFAHHMRQQLMQ